MTTTKNTHTLNSITYYGITIADVINAHAIARCRNHNFRKIAIIFNGIKMIQINCKYATINEILDLLRWVCDFSRKMRVTRKYDIWFKLIHNLYVNGIEKKLTSKFENVIAKKAR